MATDGVVMRYVASSQRGRGPLIAMQADLPKMIVERKAGMPVEYGVKGAELMRVLRNGCTRFVHAMEMQGLTLIPLPGGNPLCVTHEDGTPYGTFSVTKSLLQRMPDELEDYATEGKGPTTQKEPRSLEDSEGWVDYRFVGVFWAPRVSLEIAVARDKLLAKESAAKNPTVWGGGSATPNRPSIAR